MPPSQQQSLLRNRLAHDIVELHEQPYPGITLHIQDNDAFQTACLILSPEGQPPLHLTVDFGPQYPLDPPLVTIQSDVIHPNVFGNYICATILNTKEGYTAAYTLKGLCIQLLSFFNSDFIEQDHGNGSVNRKEWEQAEFAAGGPPVDTSYKCQKCGFGGAQISTATTHAAQDGVVGDSMDFRDESEKVDRTLTGLD